MKAARSTAIVSIAVLVFGLILFHAGLASAGGPVPAGVSPSPTPTSCPITGLRFSFLVIDSNGNPVQIDHGNTPSIVYGDPVAYGAALDSIQGTDVSNQPIDFHRVIVGESADRILTLQTDSDGVAKTTDVPRQSASYFATWTGTGTCAGTTFETGTVTNGVRVSITNSSSNYHPRAGATFLIRGGVSPIHPGKIVTIQWYRVGASSTIHTTSAVVDSHGHYSKTFTSSTHGAQWRFRAIFAKQDADHQANFTGWSSRVTVQ